MVDKTRNEAVDEQEERRVLTEKIVAELNKMPTLEMAYAVFYVEGKASNYNPPTEAAASAPRPPKVTT